MLAGCSQRLSVSVNEQAVYDPSGRLIVAGVGAQVRDPNLQGCINFAMGQQGLTEADQLLVLSCPGSEISGLDNISQFNRLRFLDLANNDISDLSPLLRLDSLRGVNLSNNPVGDISPLINNSSVDSVSLTGNYGIPCGQLELLRRRLGGNLEAPDRCQD